MAKTWTVQIATAVDKGWGESRKYKFPAPSPLEAIRKALTKQVPKGADRIKVTGLSVSVQRG